MRNEIAARVKALRLRLDMTGDEVAAASKVLNRTEISKIETGKNQATTDRVRTGLARAFGVNREMLGEYLEKRISLDALLAHGATQAAGGASGPVMHDHPQWAAIAEALVTRWGFAPSLVDQTGRMTWAWDWPLESADEHTVLQIIRAVDDAGKRAQMAS